MQNHDEWASYASTVGGKNTWTFLYCGEKHMDYHIHFFSIIFPIFLFLFLFLPKNRIEWSLLRAKHTSVSFILEAWGKISQQDTGIFSNWQGCRLCTCQCFVHSGAVGFEIKCFRVRLGSKFIGSVSGWVFLFKKCIYAHRVWVRSDSGLFRPGTDFTIREDLQSQLHLRLPKGPRSDFWHA